MIVITLTNCPISLRGDLTKWLVEINTGVFVGKVSARVRDNLWKKVEQNVRNGRATLVYSTNNEQHMDFRIHNSENEIIDFDGLKLVMKPSTARTQHLTKKRMGFSKAGKMQMVKRKQFRSEYPTSENYNDYPNNYVVVDLETSGLDAEKDAIIEIGMLKVCGNKIIDTFHVLINPEIRINPQIEKLTGITNEILKKDGVKISNVLPDIRNFIDDYIVIGHNVNFDLTFLNKAFSSCSCSPLGSRYYDTMKMYEHILNGHKASKKLKDIAEKYGIQVNSYHRGLDDCYTVKTVYDILKNQLKINMARCK